MAGVFNGLGDLFTGNNRIPDYPGATPEEKRLQAAQTALLDQQRAQTDQQLGQQKLLAPLLYENAGLKPIYGATPGQGDTGLEFQNGKWVQVRPNTVGQPTITGFERLPPTPEQQAARTQQEATMRQLKLNEMLQPYQLAQMGYQLQRDAEGNVTGVTEDPNSNAAMERQLQRQFMERSGQAMRGELPVDPSLQRQFDSSERVLRDSLMKNFGPGYETSTPAIEALADFNERKNNTIFSAQHGEIGSAAQLALAMQQGNTANFGSEQRLSGPALTSAAALQPFSQSGTSGASMTNMLGSVQAPFQGLGGLGSLSQLYQGPIGNLGQERANAYGGDIYQDKNDMNNIFWRATAQSAGTTLGSGITGGAGAAKSGAAKGGGGGGGGGFIS